MAKVSGISQANRGRALEMAIEQACAQYLSSRIAVIQKVATPTKVLTDRRGGTKVIRERSTVDFVGAWRGKALAFDAKENRSANFPLKNIHDHQFDFLANWDRDGGIAFLLILHEPDQRVYLMPFDILSLHWELWKAGDRASVSADEIRQLLRVPAGRGCTIDFLAALDGWLQANGGAP